MLYLIDLAVALPLIFIDQKLLTICLFAGLISSFVSRINEPSIHFNPYDLKTSVICFLVFSFIFLLVFNNYILSIPIIISIILKYFLGKKLKSKKKFIIPENIEYSPESKNTYDFLKRITDLAISLVFLLLLSPVILVVAIAIKFSTGSPVFITQKRIGLNEKMFSMYKFRTFSKKFRKKEITKIGKIIRPLRIDEIPQFINVLKGEMSLVGPRPELPVFHKMAVKNVPNYKMRLLVKPGITGWAQINYKYTTSAEEYYKKTGYDLYYVKYRSFVLDIKCIFKTPYAIFRSIISK
ncbi:MAG: sugar transferase [Kosmotogaceae bacterium]